MLEQLRDALRIKHYSYSPEKTYVYWVKRYILFHNKQHPAEMGALEIKAFLPHLAQEANVFVLHTKTGVQRPDLSLSKWFADRIGYPRTKPKRKLGMESLSRSVDLSQLRYEEVKLSSITQWSYGR